MRHSTIHTAFNWSFSMLPGPSLHRQADPQFSCPFCVYAGMLTGVGNLCFSIKQTSFFITMETSCICTEPVVMDYSAGRPSTALITYEVN